MPRASRLIVTALTATLLVLLGSVPALSVPGAIHTLGTASSFSITTGGLAIKGGLADWEYACVDCAVGFTIGPPDHSLAAQDGTVYTQLQAGTYRIDGFRGYASYDFVAPHVFFIELHGVGRFSQT